MGELVIAIDQGTTGTTVLVIDPAGTIRGRAYGEIRQYFPNPGWVEHDPEEIASSAVLLTRRAMRAAGAKAADIAAIGITNQRETFVVWERASGRPVGQGDRLAMPPQRRHLRTDAPARGRDRQAHRPRSRSLLFRLQAEVDARSRSHFAAARRARRTLLRNHRQLAHLQVVRRSGTYHRLHECVAHDAVQLARAGVGHG